MYSFILLAYASLAASKALLQWLLACLNFTLDSEDLWLVQTEKNDSYELWQQYKQLKTMKMSEAWPDTYDKEHIIQFQPEPVHSLKISSCGTSLKWSQRPSQSAQE